MLKADAEGITPQALVAKIAATRPKHLDGFHISFDHWHSTDSPENVELSQDIYRRLRDRVPSLITTKPVEQFYDPVKEMFLPDRYIKGECPKCGAKDQYGDACESCGVAQRADRSDRTLLDGLGRDAGEEIVGPFLLPALRPGMRRIPARRGRRRRDGCSPKSRTRRWSGWATRPRAARASPTGTSRATRRISASRSPTRRASTSMSGSMRRSATSRASRRTSRSRASISADVPAEPRRRAVSLHRQGHRLLPHAVLAGDARVRRRAVQGARQRVRPRLHHGVGREDVEVARHRRQPRPSTSTSG